MTTTRVRCHRGIVIIYFTSYLRSGGQQVGSGTLRRCRVGCCPLLLPRRPSYKFDRENCFWRVREQLDIVVASGHVAVAVERDYKL